MTFLEIFIPTMFVSWLGTLWGIAHTHKKGAQDGDSDTEAST
jgi:hypothetical protein